MSKAEIPALVSEIIDLIGLDLAIAFLEAVGGREVYLPASVPDDGHWLVIAIGHDAACQMVEHFRLSERSGTRLEVPTGAYLRERFRWELRFDDALATGKSAGDVAVEAGVHVRTVSRWLKKLDVRLCPSRGNVKAAA